MYNCILCLLRQEKTEEKYWTPEKDAQLKPLLLSVFFSLFSCFFEVMLASKSGTYIWLLQLLERNLPCSQPLIQDQVLMIACTLSVFEVELNSVFSLWGIFCGLFIKPPTPCTHFLKHIWLASRHLFYRLIAHPWHWLGSAAHLLVYLHPWIYEIRISYLTWVPSEGAWSFCSLPPPNLWSPLIDFKEWNINQTPVVLYCWHINSVNLYLSINTCQNTVC